MSLQVAVAGATGNVGREILNIMAERSFPAANVIALASSRSVGQKVAYGDERELSVQDLATFDFSGTDIVLSSPGGAISAQYAPKAAAAGAVVIDNTSHFRMDPAVPLVVPEVNPEAVGNYIHKRIIANPNCSTIQMVLALNPLHQHYKIKRVVVSTYQSTSGGGKNAMDELFNQTKGIYVNRPASETRTFFTKQIAFNAIPHIDKFMEDGSTKEEWKMNVETKKILDPDIKVHANCCRIPSFVGHGEYINVETHTPLNMEDIRSVLQDAPGVVVVDYRADEGYVTPVECAGEDAVYISRIRLDQTTDNGLSFWCVSDNLRKGAALNTVQIAELLAEKYLKKAA